MNMKQPTFFDNLEEFIKENDFQPTHLPWYLENRTHTLVQVEDKDSHGYTIYNIGFKRNDDTIYRGRLPNSHIAKFIFWCVQEDYLLNNTDIPTL